MKISARFFRNPHRTDSPAALISGDDGLKCPRRACDVRPLSQLTAVTLSLILALSGPGARAQAPAAAQPAPAPAAPATPAAPAPQGTPVGIRLNFASAPLYDVIDMIAKELHLNYAMDAAISHSGSVTINTYGEVRDTDLQQLLETILRLNNLAMVKVGDIYNIVPVANVARQPITPVSQSDSKEFGNDEHEVLNLVFLRYMTSSEMLKILEPFAGEGAKITSYDPANLLIILDNSRNMRRTLDLINMFDSDTFAGQRVRAFEVKNGRPTDIKKDLDDVFKAYSLSTGTKGGGAVQFVALDRINEILAVAPNPGVFTVVESWLAKFDIPAKVTAGSVTNYVYHVKYQQAQVLGTAVGQLYGIPVNNVLGGMYGAATGNSAYPASGGIGGAGAGFGGGLNGGIGMAALMVEMVMARRLTGARSMAALTTLSTRQALKRRLRQPLPSPRPQPLEEPASPVHPALPPIRPVRISRQERPSTYPAGRELFQIPSTTPFWSEVRRNCGKRSNIFWTSSMFRRDRF